MNRNKKGFLLYKNQYDIFKYLSYEQAGRLIKDIFKYEIDGESPKYDIKEEQALTIAFSSIKSDLDLNEERYAEKCKSNSINGKKGCNARYESSIRQLAESEDHPYCDIMLLYNDICTSFPKAVSITDKRILLMKDCLESYNIDDFKNVFEKAERSNFLKNNTKFHFNFDWMIQKKNMEKILNGNYDISSKNGFKNLEERTYNMNSLEYDLLE